MLRYLLRVTGRPRRACPFRLCDLSIRTAPDRTITTARHSKIGFGFQTPALSLMPRRALSALIITGWQ